MQGTVWEASHSHFQWTLENLAKTLNANNILRLERVDNIFTVTSVEITLIINECVKTFI